LPLVGVAGGVHGLLVEGRRHHGVDLAGEGQPSRLLRPAHGCIPVPRIHLAPAVRRHVDGGVVEDVDRARGAGRFPDSADPPDRETSAGRIHRALEDPGVPDDQRHAPLDGACVGERFDGDLGPDASGIAHGDRNAGTTRHWLSSLGARCRGLASWDHSVTATGTARAGRPPAPTASTCRYIDSVPSRTRPHPSPLWPARRPPRPSRPRSAGSRSSETTAPANAVTSSSGTTRAVAPSTSPLAEPAHATTARLMAK